MSEEIIGQAELIIEKAEMLKEESYSEKETLSKNLINDWIFEIEGSLEIIKKEADKLGYAMRK